MPDVMLATDAEHAEIGEDELPLADAIRERGLSVEARVWGDPAVDWGSARIVVVRYVFDYVRTPEAFCDWIDRLPNVHNPARLVRWNSHKSYLRDLEAAGVSTVPTAWLAAGTEARLTEVLEAHGWHDVVVKPAVDNGARGTMRVTTSDLSRGQAHLEALLGVRDMMIQPYVAATEGPGEHKLIHIDGQFSHAILERPRLGDKDFHLDLIGAIDPDPEELSLAERILALIPESPLLYSRVDVVMDEGVARLMELEVIEPVLFFTKAPGAAEALAEAIERRLSPPRP